MKSGKKPTHVTFERPQRRQRLVSQSFESETHVIETSERSRSEGMKMRRRARCCHCKNRVEIRVRTTARTFLVRWSQTRRAGAHGALERADPGAQGARIDVRLPVSYPQRRRANGSAADPTVRLPALRERRRASSSSSKSIHRFWRQRRATPTACRSRRHARASEHGQESGSTGMHGFVERFLGSLTADGVGEEHGENVQHVVAPNVPAGKSCPGVLACVGKTSSALLRPAREESLAALLKGSGSGLIHRRYGSCLPP